MRKKSFNRMIKKVHEINQSELAYDIKIKRLLPLEQQQNYNKLLKEWYGPKDYEIVAETKAIFHAFKESEEWKEIGMLSVNDYKITLNDNIPIDFNYIVERVKDGRLFEVIFIREYIGENIVGLRPVVNNV